MSVLSKLFEGIGKKDKIDENVNNLFQVEAGPVVVKKTNIKAHQTSTPGVSDSDSSDEDSKADENESDKDSDSSFEEDVADIATAKEQEPPTKKRKQLDEDEALEEKYFDRLLKRPKEGSGADSKSFKADTTANDDESISAKKKAQETAKSIDLKEKELEKSFTYGFRRQCHLQGHYGQEGVKKIQEVVFTVRKSRVNTPQIDIICRQGPKKGSFCQEDVG